MKKIKVNINALMTFALILSVGAMVLISEKYKYYHYWSDNRVAFLYFFEMAAAICISCYFRKIMPRFKNSSKYNRQDILALVILITSITGFIGHFGMKQFGGYDMSLMIDAGWRVFQGQIPNEDFICTLPPSFNLGLKYAYRLFGVQWSSIIILNAISSGISTVWIYILLRSSDFDRLHTCLLTFLAHASTTMLTGFWWYNPVLSINICLFYLTVRLIVKVKKPTAPLIVSLILSMLLILMGKPNGWISLPFFALACFPDKKKLMLYSCGLCISIFLMCLILRLENIDSIAMFNAYRSVSRSRGIHNPINNIILSGNIRIDNIMFYFTFFYLFIVAARGNYKSIKIASAIDNHTARIQITMLNFSLFIVVFALFNTNVDIKNMDLMPLMLSVILTEMIELDNTSNPGKIAGILNQLDFSRLCLITIQICVMFYLVNSLYIGVNRLRVMRIGPLVYYEDPPLQKMQHSNFFEGLSSGKILQEMVDEVDSIVQPNRHQKYFFGPRIEFFYASCGLPSPERLPVWWHGGTSYPLSLISDIADAWNHQKFDILIFPKNDIFVFTDAKFGEYPFFPDLIKRSIRDRYSVDHTSFRHISVAYRKSDLFINNNVSGSNERSATQ